MPFIYARNPNRFRVPYSSACPPTSEIWYISSLFRRYSISSPEIALGLGLVDPSRATGSPVAAHTWWA